MAKLKKIENNHKSPSSLLQLICLLLFVSPATILAKDILISTSSGIYKLGEHIPSSTSQLPSGDKITAFKVLYTDDNRQVSAWGVGRKVIPIGNNLVASVKIANNDSPDKLTTLFESAGPRIRDFVLHKDYILAVGHNRADIHLFSLKTQQHFVKHLSKYEDAITHSIRAGDVDGDGKTEFYVTVTTSNVAGGLGQEGQVFRIDLDEQNFTLKDTVILDAYEKYGSHVKEVAVFDIDGDDNQELLVEVAPQIELYGPDTLDYIEPMRFLALRWKKGSYAVEQIAEANIRLGRTLTYSDIDNDGLNELLFIDYYESGIYAIESDKDPVKAIGNNINQLKSRWSLTNIKVMDKNGKDMSFTARLKSNHIIHLKNSNQLVASNDSSLSMVTKSGLNVPATPMSVHYYNIIKNSKGYYLSPDKVIKLSQRGDAWHIND